MQIIQRHRIHSCLLLSDAHNSMTKAKIRWFSLRSNAYLFKPNQLICQTAKKPNQSIYHLHNIKWIVIQLILHICHNYISVYVQKWWFFHFVIDKFSSVHGLRQTQSTQIKWVIHLCSIFSGANQIYIC